jgi:NAD(P)-dependent dehydrogenase (short-subunit alcohol dehydrogenase family)
MTLDLTPQTLTDDALAALVPQHLFGLHGKVALVTGAAGGMGQWFAAVLAAAGADVVLTDIAPPVEVAGRLEEAGYRAWAVAGDLADEDTPGEIVRAATAQFGRLDVVVNNAGVNRRQPALEVDRAAWELISQIDLRAPFQLARAAAAQMITQGSGGSIINLSSLTNFVGLGNVSVYGMHKAALAQMAKSLAVEWSSHRIRVNCLAPGLILTPLTRGLWDSPVTRQWLLDRIPMRRPGSPSELVGTCLLLASDAGSYITGQTIAIEGGFLAGTDWTRSVDINGIETASS